MNQNITRIQRRITELRAELRQAENELAQLQREDRSEIAGNITKRRKNNTGRWYFVEINTFADESEYDRADELDFEDMAHETTCTAHGPFNSAYDANLRYWEEMRYDDTTFDENCAENDIDPDIPEESGEMDNEDSDPCDRCIVEYRVVDEQELNQLCNEYDVKIVRN